MFLHVRLLMKSLTTEWTENFIVIILKYAIEKIYSDGIKLYHILTMDKVLYQSESIDALTEWMSV